MESTIPENSERVLQEDGSPAQLVWADAEVSGEELAAMTRQHHSNSNFPNRTILNIPAQELSSCNESF